MADHQSVIIGVHSHYHAGWPQFKRCYNLMAISANFTLRPYHKIKLPWDIVGWCWEHPTTQNHCRLAPLTLRLPPPGFSCQTQTEGPNPLLAGLAWGRGRLPHVFRKLIHWSSLSVTP